MKFIELGEQFATAVLKSGLKRSHVANLMEVSHGRLRAWLLGTGKPDLFDIYNVVRFISMIEYAEGQGLLPDVDDAAEDGIIYPKYYKVLWVRAEREVELHELFYGVSPLAKAMADLKVKPSDIQPFLAGYAGNVKKVVMRARKTRMYLDAFVRVTLALKFIQGRGGFKINQFDPVEFGQVLESIRGVELPLRK